MIRLFINWYTEIKQPRGKELNTCIENNFRCKYINEIINLSDTPLPDGKIVNIPINERPTYNDFLLVIGKIAKPDDISIIANLDIYFDETILLCNKMRAEDCYALTRWDDWGKNNVTFLNRRDSQDAWIFKGKPKPLNADFHLGRSGCDNAFAHILKKAGYRVSNPSLTIKTYHVHNSGTRHYETNRVASVPQPYLLLDPIKLQTV